MKTKWLVVFGACGLAAISTWAQQPDLSALMGAMNSMMNNATNKTAAAVVDFRELRALLPESVGAVKRTSISGEKNSAMGMTVSQAEAIYSSGKTRATVKILDYGGTGMAAMMSSAWSMHEIDRETESGYERSTTIKGQKALERFDAASKDGSLQILVAGRFMVEIDLRDGTDKDMESIANALDLDKLAALK